VNSKIKIEEVGRILCPARGGGEAAVGRTGEASNNYSIIRAEAYRVSGVDEESREMKPINSRMIVR
jgi:hypothetical protein